MRFLCDSMLGKLARWLRLLGYDCNYFRDIEDRKLLELSRTDDRILVTRDQGLVQKAQKKELKVQQITGVILLDQLKEVVQRWNLGIDIIPDKARCSTCNGTVKLVKKICVQGKVHEGTFVNHNKFWECTECGKIYWKGAHWEHIIHVERMLKLTAKSP